MTKKKEKEELKEETTKTAENAENEAREEEVLLHEKEKELEECKARLAETEDRYLRTLAEYDNFKKRTVREKEEIYFASKADVVKKLLPVFDNLDRAKMATDGEEYRKGVEMILGQFNDVLGAMEIRPVGQVGEEFDPMLHEAVFREEKEGVPENTITEVLQKGWAFGDKVIRHAVVKVSF